MPVTLNANTSTGFIATSDLSGVMALQTGGTTAMTIDGSQNIGIGTTGPSARLTIPSALYTSSTTSGMIRFQNPNIAADSCIQSYYVTGAGSDIFIGSNAYIDTTGNYARFSGSYASSAISVRRDGDIYFATNGSAGIAVERMRITSGGIVLAGTSTAPAGNSIRMVLSNSVGAGIQFNNSTSSAGGAINATAGSGLVFFSYTGAIGSESYTERVRINSDGNFLVGTATDITSGGTSVARACFDSGSGQNGMKVKTNNTSYAAYISTTTGSDHYFGYMNNSAGTNVGYIFCTNTTTTYNTGSDYRLKENIAPMTGALAKVQQLKPCTYTWKADGSTGEGFIAHELQEIVPVCVNGEKDAVDKNGKPIYQGVDYSKLVTTLTAAIQELKAELDATKAEVAALKGAE